MEKKTAKNSLKAFFSPKSIAIIGASDHEEKVGGILLKKLIKSEAKVIPVNPKHEKAMGIRCYKNILDYKGKIDLAVIAIPAPFVIGALNECGQKGVKNAIIISAGFSEIGNTKGEEELAEAAKKFGIRFLGSNCFGICNPSRNLDATFSATMPKAGEIAFISQSGALWSYLADFSAGLSESNKEKEIGFSSFASLGNMADLEFSDFIEYFTGDKQTKSIILYIEKLKDGKRFMDACIKCGKKGKKIYAVKAGSSQKGAEAAFSHTASIASDYLIYKGILKQAGVEICDSLVEALEKASGKPLIDRSLKKEIKVGKRAHIITNAGGAGALLVDYLSQKGFEIAEHPLDLLGTATASDYFNALEKIKSQDFYDSVIVILTAQSMSEVKKTAQAIEEFKGQTGKQIIALFLGGANASMKEANKIFEENKIPYFNTLEEARINISA